MNIPNNLKYTKSHEWVEVHDNFVTVGITDYAQDHLGDVVYVELPVIGDSVKQRDDFAVVESVKAVSDIYAPIGGEVSEVNEALQDAPETINTDCYGDGWIVKIDISTLDDLDTLLTPDQYQAYLAEETA